METNFEPGRVFANERDFQLNAWFSKVNARQHRSIRARPVDRLAEELEVMGSLPQIAPDCDRRWVLRVGADPYVRFDTCDYSLDPDLVGRRIEIGVTDREVLGIVLDTGELACQHARSFGRHRTITALEYVRALKPRRAARTGLAWPSTHTEQTLRGFKAADLNIPRAHAQRVHRPGAGGRRTPASRAVGGPAVP